MRVGFVSLLISVIFLTLFTGCFNVAVASRIIYVPTDFATIQEAINNAEEGDTIFVYNGNYFENVVVDKAVSLVGEDKATTVIDGGGTGVVVKIVADNVSLSSFTVRNGGLDEQGAGILLYKVRYINISDVVASSSFRGLNFLNSTFGVVQGNHIFDCNVSLFLNYSNENFVSGNVLLNATVAGIYVDNSLNNTLEGNSVESCGVYGVYLKSSPFNKLFENDVFGCERGVLLEFSGNCSFFGNNVSENRFNFGVVGNALSDFVQDVDVSNKVDGKPIFYLVSKRDVILSEDAGYLGIVNCSNIRVRGLSLRANWDGFLCAFSSDCLVENSSIVDSKRAAFVYYSPRCSFVNVSFVGNLEGVSFVSSEGGLVKKSFFVSSGDYGLRLEASSSCVVESNVFEGNVGGGVNVYSSPACNVSGNTFLGNGFGVLVQVSNGTFVGGNVFLNNTGDAVYFSYSGNCSAFGNVVRGNSGYGVGFLNSNFSVAVGNVIENNTGSGVYFYSCAFGYVFSNVIRYNDVGIVLQNCPNSTISKNDVVGSVREGVRVKDSTGCNVLNNTVLNSGGEGLIVEGSGNSTVDGDVVWGNARFGLWLQGSRNVVVLGCNVSFNGWDGVYLRESDGTRISSSVMDANGDAGCRLYSCSVVSVLNCNFSGNREGLRIFLSNSNVISGNRIALNREFGVYVYNSTGNRFYHNSFINNTQQVRVLEARNNIWDDGYPSGGNYWSDYAGVDVYWGPNQNQPGSDGIGDTPHTIDEENKDRYPLMALVRFHDLTIVGVVLPSSEVYVGWVFNVNVSVRNNGSYVESVNVTVYCNDSLVGFRSASNLAVGEVLTLGVSWNTSGLRACNSYNVRAEVSIVVGETYVEDNVFVWGFVKVKMVGDVSGDGLVNILDIHAIAKSFGSEVGGPKYSVVCDMNLDGLINIVDLFLAAKNFNKTCV
jgi:parallel beta-helix repeat protein